MAIAASGAVSFSDLRTEYYAGSGAISYSDLYRGGSYVRAKAGDNPATNLAASVPTSGVITLGNFRGSARGWKYTYTAGATNQTTASLFGSDDTVDYPKEVVVPVGITLGGVGAPALTCSSSTGGALTITVAGSIIGYGGAANGGAGGSAIATNRALVSIVNSGIIAGGGGGGGQGGQGGNGSYSSSSSYNGYNSCYIWYQSGGGGRSNTVYYNCSVIKTGLDLGSFWYGGAYFVKGGAGPNSCNQPADDNYCSGYTRTATVSTTGGSGGSGGVGQGYNQSLTSGSSGASGGNNAGSGGQGADGASYGNAGSTGSSGANGNSTNGSAGSSGGAAGAAVAGYTVTMTNTGNLYGAVA